MLCAILSSVPYPALRYSSTLFNKWHDLLKQVTENKIVFRFSLRVLSEAFFILRIIQRHVYIYIYIYIYIHEGWNFNSGNYLFTTDTK